MAAHGHRLFYLYNRVSGAHVGAGRLWKRQTLWGNMKLSIRNTLLGGKRTLVRVGFLGLPWGPEVGARARVACRAQPGMRRDCSCCCLLLLRAAEVRFTCLAGADGKPNKGQAGQSVIATGFLLHHHATDSLL
jgi:hypothetical protein